MKKKWVKAVTKITASYEEKVKRVEEHIIVLRKEQKKNYSQKRNKSKILNYREDLRVNYMRLMMSSLHYRLH